MNDIEKLKAYHSISCFLSDELKEKVLKELELDSSSLDKRLSGRNGEIEFLLILKILNQCKHIIGFEESVSTLTGSYTPDLFIELKNGERFFIEIKTTDKEKFNISKGNLDRRIKFCNDMGYDLYFAIKVNGFWLLLNQEYVQKRRNQINFKEDYLQSQLQKKFNSNWIMFPEGMEIRSVYSKFLDIDNSLGNIGHYNYGGLKKYEIYYKDRLIFAADEETVIFSVLLEELHDNMAGQYSKNQKLNDTDTLVIERLEKNTLFQDFTFRLRPIYHILSEKYSYDINRFFKEFISREQQSYNIYLDDIYALVEKFIKCKIPIYYCKEIKLNNSITN